jgi:hypothetical protein
MKVHASFSRKIGLPNYSSVGAECSVEIDTETSDPAAVVKQIRLAYAIAADAVQEQLQAALDAAPAAPAAPAQTDRPTADRPTADRRRPEPEPEPEPEPSEDREPPRDGRQLLGWLTYFDRVDGRKWLPELTRWGKEQGFTWRVTEWTEDEVSEAVEWFLKLRAGKVRRAARDGGGRNGKAFDRFNAEADQRDLADRRSGREARNGRAR